MDSPQFLHNQVAPTNITIHESEGDKLIVECKEQLHQYRHVLFEEYLPTPNPLTGYRKPHSAPEHKPS